jgi:hypothetical protein
MPGVAFEQLCVGRLLGLLPGEYDIVISLEQLVPVLGGGTSAFQEQRHDRHLEGGPHQPRRPFLAYCVMNAFDDLLLLVEVIGMASGGQSFGVLEGLRCLERTQRQVLEAGRIKLIRVPLRTCSCNQKEISVVLGRCVLEFGHMLEEFIASLLVSHLVKAVEYN